MREGFYKFDYLGVAGSGSGVLVLDTGMVVGADVTGGTYDGEYEWNEQKQHLDVKVSVWIPEGVLVVQGVTAPSKGLRFEVRCAFPRKPDNQVIIADTEFGPVELRIHFLRSFP